MVNIQNKKCCHQQFFKDQYTIDLTIDWGGLGHQAYYHRDFKAQLKSALSKGN